MVADRLADYRSAWPGPGFFSRERETTVAGLCGERQIMVWALQDLEAVQTVEARGIMALAHAFSTHLLNFVDATIRLLESAETTPPVRGRVVATLRSHRDE
jgi:hypothetical protein